MNVSMENLYVDVGAYRVKNAETIFVQNTNWEPLCRKHTMQSAAITVFFLRHLEHPYLLLTVVRKASPQP